MGVSVGAGLGVSVGADVGLGVASVGKTVGRRVGFWVGWRVGAGVAAHDELFNGTATKPSKHLQLKWLFAVYLSAFRESPESGPDFNNNNKTIK